MRKLTLLSALLLVGAVLVSSSWAATYKFKSTPHLPIMSGQTTVDQIYVPTNVKMTNVRIGLHAKVVYYSTLRIVLTSPTGQQVILKNEVANGAANMFFGSLGSERSYTLFQDNGSTSWVQADQPFDRPMAPVTMLASISGKTSGGWWTMQVIDTRNQQGSGGYPSQEGFLEGWSLVFNSVVAEPEAVLWSQVKTGPQLIGQLNGQMGMVPNQKTPVGPLCGATGEPNVTPGLNGEAYPFIIANLGYPGLLVGQSVPGYTTPGRFRVTVDISCAPPPPYTGIKALTQDIAVYFGKVATFTPPLQAPPAPKNPGVTAPWPSGGATTTNTLLGGNGLHGGVRLTACNGEDATPWNVPGSDETGYITTSFDDRALVGIWQADLCGGPLGDGVCGNYRPETPLTGLNGQPVEGLYYVTVYDTYCDGNIPVFGHVRVLSLLVEYLAGGGEVESNMLHEGIAGPLMGVPIPGAITGSSLGYLPDVIGTVPPYSIHAKDQDPVLLFWGVQKMGPRTAVGWENVERRNGTTFVLLAGDGPYAYPGTLDSNPLKAGSTVNADLASMPTGSYYLRSKLSQQRYDDDNSDNWIETQNPIEMTNTTMGFYGTLVNQYNHYQVGNHQGIYASLPLQATGSALSGIGQTFTVFKYPSTKVTSVDYKFDLGMVVNATWRTPVRISVWRCSTGSGYTGAPVGPPVAKSPTINANEYMLGNWRSFPLYACDPQGNITTNPSVDLTPGSYVFMLDNMAATNVLVYPYTFGAMPFMADRYHSFQFNENFGPLGPFAQLGTRFVYQYNAGGTAAPSAGISGASTPNTWGNFSLPMRVNMTNLNDFAINYMSINGTFGTEAVSITNAPFQPNVIVTANSLQGGNTKDFNMRLEIFDAGGNRVYLGDVNYGPGGSPNYPGINAYQTVSVPMPQWNPSVAGMYRVKAFFSRKPDDQNPANDTHEYWLYVSATRAILATGSSTNPGDIASTVTTLKEKGVSVEVMNMNDPKIAAAKGTDVYLLGNVDANAKGVIATAIENGNNIAFIYNREEKIGKLLQSVDNVFEIERPGADYSKMDLFPKIEENASYSKSVAPLNADVKFASKEELVAFIRSAQRGVEPVEMTDATPQTNPELAATLVPAEVKSPYGSIQYVDHSVGSTGILFAVPENRKVTGSTVDAVIPQGFSLDQNYPNPFNPSTVISYALPQTSVVTLRVLDMLGREVMTLANGTQEAGRYTMSWKGLNNIGENVASGSYFYRLDATPVDGGQPFTSMKKMTLSK